MATFALFIVLGGLGFVIKVLASNTDLFLIVLEAGMSQIKALLWLVSAPRCVDVCLLTVC